MMEEDFEEFTVWKGRTRLIYDLVVSHSMESPSLTVQWLPTPPTPYGREISVHKMILGTHAKEGSPNYLIVANAFLLRDLDSSPLATDFHESYQPKVTYVQRIKVDGEVLRARCMMQNPSLVAARTSGSDVYVFDCTKHLGDPETSSCDPEVLLKGHEKNGWGLSWSPLKEGHLISASDDCKICLWDVSAMPQEKVLEANHIYEGHESVVQDVSWHATDQNLFGSVGNDSKLILWDLRTNEAQKSLVAHEKPVNSISFNPFMDWVLATGSSDTTVGIFDLRKLSLPVHALSCHEKEVFQVGWDPHHTTTLASAACDDTRLMVWDTDRIGDEPLEGAEEGCPSELIFCHKGHKGMVYDFSWNKNEPWVISTVSEDSAVQIWKMSECTYNDDMED